MGFELELRREAVKYTRERGMSIPAPPASSSQLALVPVSASKAKMKGRGEGKKRKVFKSSFAPIGSVLPAAHDDAERV